MEDHRYERQVRSAEGKHVTRYTAIDPADEAISCTCGKPECTRARLRPFRQHIAGLHELLSRLMSEEMAVSESSGWFGVLYGLRMAASIEDVIADTGYVEDPLVFEFCEPTIDYENAQSEMASKYVAGATIFNFLWLAYESAVALAAPNELVGLLKGERLGERGRRLFEARPDLSDRFAGLKDLVRLAVYECRQGELLDKRLDRLKTRFSGHNFITAAEICREFRNFLFHGEDQVPDHEDWGSQIVSRCRLYRFYTVSRLLLYLIQAIAWIELGEANDLIEPLRGHRAIPLRTALEELQFSTSKSLRVAIDMA
ncbi:hypothetical protein ACFPT7_22095 [Acidicapsa dinghuensis]|uniref:ApeA N-terminal domain-containing protein n=1 Tax=Acidicapsa dinghuensis TaxID=2218256 RepID=A0ABW1EL45_9BACT|nr:hypothetical protein [Acidicapsa dinghuensis]